jgi:tetratricopeptide (TPR) repeat protein
LGEFDQALNFARYKYRAAPSAPLVIGAMQINDHRLDYASSVSAAVKGAKIYPNDGPLISEALKFTALGGDKDAVNAILSKSTFPGAATVAEHYTRMYASMATLPAFVRGGILAGLQVYSLAFREFDSVADRLSTDQAFLIARNAYQEQLWNSSLRYIDLALVKDEKAEYRLWRGMVLLRLGKQDEACQMFKQALLKANEDEHARIMSVAASCDLFKPN